MLVVGLHVPEAVDGDEAADDPDDHAHDEGELVRGERALDGDASSEEDFGCHREPCLQESQERHEVARAHDPQHEDESRNGDFQAEHGNVQVFGGQLDDEHRHRESREHEDDRAPRDHDRGEHDDDAPRRVSAHEQEDQGRQERETDEEWEHSRLISSLEIIPEKSSGVYREPVDNSL